MKHKCLLLVALAMTSTATFANTPAFNYIEAGYAIGDIDDVDDISPKGFAFGGNFLIDENIFVTATYATLGDKVSNSDIDAITSSVGVGYRFSLIDTTDAYASVSYQFVEAEARQNEIVEREDESGYGLTVGVRSRLTEQFELDGSVRYLDIADESETSVGISANYYFKPDFAVGLSYSKTSDLGVKAISVRYTF